MAHQIKPRLAAMQAFFVSIGVMPGLGCSRLAGVLGHIGDAQGLIGFLLDQAGLGGGLLAR